MHLNYLKLVTTSNFWLFMLISPLMLLVWYALALSVSLLVRSSSSHCCHP